MFWLESRSLLTSGFLVFAMTEPNLRFQIFYNNNILSSVFFFDPPSLDHC
jgi:hypothetical protein